MMLISVQLNLLFDWRNQLLWGKKLLTVSQHKIELEGFPFRVRVNND